LEFCVILKKNGGGARRVLLAKANEEMRPIDRSIKALSRNDTILLC
jgi:hypothetical protein